MNRLVLLPAWVAALFAATCLLMTAARAADDLTQPIRVSPDGHFLTQPDGQPFFWLGDTAWALFARLTREEADVYLQDRAAKGFNMVQAVAIGGPFDTLEVPNRYGELALIGKDPTRPNPKYFEHIDWVVERAAQYGIRIAMLPVWGASLVGGLWSKEEIFTPATAQEYGRWIAQRYRGKGVVWILGGDTNPLWPKDLDFLAAAKGKASKPPDMTIIDYRPIYDAMAKGLLAGEGADPLITFHPNPVSYSGTAHPRTSLYFRDRPWFGMNMLQSSHYANEATTIFPWLLSDYTLLGPLNYQAVRKEYDSTPVRPVVDGEPRYEGLPVDIKYDAKKGSWNAYDTRNAAYHAVFAGAAGHTFGNTSVHLSLDPSIREADKPILKDYPDIGGTWREQLDSPGARQMRHIKALMLSRPYFTRIPDQSLIVGEAGEGEAHIGATRDKSGSYALVYLPQGQTVKVEMTRLSGTRAVGWWFDPRTGEARRIAGLFATKGVTAFMPPSDGSEDDWVLVLDDEGMRFAAPGSLAITATASRD